MESLALPYDLMALKIRKRKAVLQESEPEVSRQTKIFLYSEKPDFSEKSGFF